MGLRATGTFDLGWDEEKPYYADEGASLTMVSATHTFSGDITGVGVVKLIRAMTSDPLSAGYVAIERVVASVNGRSGTFVLQHNALADRGERTLEVVVLPDSGTGGLTGIRGRLHIDIEADGTHNYNFDYALDEAPDRIAL